MTFPVYVAGVHPHVLFELLAYATGVAIIVSMRRRAGDVLSIRDRWSIAAAALVGGAVGARLLSWLSEPALVWPTGKTIVGGLAGGLIAVELTKRAMGIRTPTGDLFALPLTVGIAIGRIGCFLSGLDDHTYGTPTSWPTGVDFGDGIRRHPTALYEAAFLAVLAFALVMLRSRQVRPGVEFKLFMIAYLALRLLLDFIKPEPVVALGLSAIQLACAGVLGYYAISLTRSRRYVRA
ncbi:MAG: prolipoprotein diacylglyceryl transferase family protein [bacterium]